MKTALEDLQRSFLAGVSKEFLIWGNVNDYLLDGEEYITLRRFLLSWFKGLMNFVIFYDIASGLEFPFPEQQKKFKELIGLPQNKPLPSEPESVLSLVRAVMEGYFSEKKKPKVALVIYYAETLAPTGLGEFSVSDRVNTVNLRHLATSEEVGKGSLTILISKNMADLHASLRGRGSMLKTVEAPLPQKDDRLKFIEHTLKQGQLKTEISASDFAHLTGGITLREIEEVWSLERVANISVIKREKSRLLGEEFGDILRIVEPRWGLEKGLGALQEAKEFFWELKPYLLAGDPLMIPPAVILMGPPGTGKSALAEAVAWEWGVPFVEILNVLSVWHGESEKNALRVWSAVQSLYLCVLWWDEFDQSEAPRGSFQGDSGVSARLRQMRFKVTSDPKNCGKFLVIYATNRPDLIDSADKRPERATVRIPMLMPTLEEQEEIFRIIPARENFQTNVADFKHVAGLLRKRHGEFISGAAIVSISKLAYRFSRINKRAEVTVDDYCLAIDDFAVPPQEAESVRKWEELAVTERSNNRFLSKRGWEILKRIQQKTEKTKNRPAVVV